MVFSYEQLRKEELRVDISTFEFDEAPVDDMRLMIGALMDKYNLIGTATGRLTSNRFHIANTPKSGPSPSLHYMNGRLRVEGQHGPDVWAGTLGYADKGTTAIKLTLADRRGDGSYASVDLAFAARGRRRSTTSTTSRGSNCRRRKLRGTRARTVAKCSGFLVEEVSTPAWRAYGSPLR